MSRKEELKELMTFTSGEKKGVFVLLSAILILILANVFLDFKKRTEKVDFSEFQSEIAAFEANRQAKPEDDYLNRLDKYIVERYDTLTLFKFNPNTVRQDEWLKLGLTEKQISTITNYRDKGGSFYDKEDFRKMYGIRTKQFEILKPYIDLPDKSSYASNKRRSYPDYDKSKYKSDENPEVENYFEFNPNTISDEQWIQLGFSDKQIGTIRKYLNKGGTFRKKEDLRKIYSISEAQYLRVEDYISLPDDSESDENEFQEIIEKEPVKVDINALSAAEFARLGVFWKYNGERIEKFREALGGFLYKEQLLDIKGIKKEYYDKVEADIIVGKIKPRQIRLNFADVKELVAHPYIEYHNAIAIVEFRDKHGFIKDLNLLREQKILSQASFDKLKPYLTVD